MRRSIQFHIFLSEDYGSKSQWDENEYHKAYEVTVGHAGVEGRENSRNYEGTEKYEITDVCEISGYEA